MCAVCVFFDADDGSQLSAPSQCLMNMHRPGIHDAYLFTPEECPDLCSTFYLFWRALLVARHSLQVYFFFRKRIRMEQQHTALKLECVFSLLIRFCLFTRIAAATAFDCVHCHALYRIQTTTSRRNEDASHLYNGAIYMEMEGVTASIEWNSHCCRRQSAVFSIRQQLMNKCMECWVQRVMRPRLTYGGAPSAAVRLRLWLALWMKQ